MRSIFAASIMTALVAGPCYAQEVRPAALAFAEQHPITPDEYVLQAKSYLIVKNNLLSKLPQAMRAETEVRAREFSSFTAGLFATYTAEQTLSCLSWQSLDDVVAKHAQFATNTKEIDYPMLSALVNLKFACFTKQESDQISEAIEAKKAVEASSEQP
jgi:hypothetical protein